MILAAALPLPLDLAAYSLARAQKVSMKLKDKIRTCKPNAGPDTLAGPAVNLIGPTLRPPPTPYDNPPASFFRLRHSVTVVTVA